MDLKDKEKSIDLIPEGYAFSTASAGIRYKDRYDIALIYSAFDATVAGTFTTNSIKAAPVLLDLKKMRSPVGRAIFINSGNANACNGQRGMKDAENICKYVAKGLKIDDRLVFIASTGVIGIPLPIDKVQTGIDKLIERLGQGSLEDIARAIMTTDTSPKISSRKINVGKRKVTLTGIAKGAGMISPKMATMLCFLITDLAVEKRILNSLLKETVDKTFNLITIDGDMSTNDTVLIMANGAAGNNPLTERTKGYREFREKLLEVTDELSRMIVKDGEGATKLIIINVKGAKSKGDAIKAAFSVAKSPLVKTAVYGCDANWGRIMAALGYSSAKIKEDSVDISINGVKVVKKGLGTEMDENASRVMKRDEILIDINLNMGKASEKIYTCDLTENYVKINARYRT